MSAVKPSQEVEKIIKMFEGMVDFPDNAIEHLNGKKYTLFEFLRCCAVKDQAKKVSIFQNMGFHDNQVDTFVGFEWTRCHQDFLSKMNLNPIVENNIKKLFDKIKFQGHDKEILPQFLEYEKIGQLCKNEPSAELKNFTSLISQVQQVSVGHPKPFVFVCSSSGTGKTQLPFSLKIPLLYFVYSAGGERQQGVYRQFRAQSETFMAALSDDERRFGDLKGKTEYTLTEFDSQLLFESKLAGFLLQFIKQIKNMSSRTNWMRRQLQCPPFDVQELTLGEALTALKEMREKEGLSVSIFLDEVVDLVEFGQTKENQNRLRFVRSLLRFLRFPLVLMGTNSNAAHITHSQFTKDSREDDDKPWCYLVFKLPPMSSIFLRNARKTVTTSLTTQFKRGKTPQVITEFIQVLFDLLSSERPLFVHEIVDTLNQQIQDINSAQDIINFMEKTFSDIYNNFIKVKNCQSNEVFANAQASFLNPRAKSLVNPEGDAQPSCFINKHIAYINVPHSAILGSPDSVYLPLFFSNHSRGCLSLVATESHLRYDTIITRTAQSDNPQHELETLVATSSMPAFDKEPLTGLIFSGPKRSLLTVFIEERSVLAQQLNKRMQSNTHGDDQWKALARDGGVLERVAMHALIVSSHANGFKGHPNFRHFLPHFLRQLQPNISIMPSVDFSLLQKLFDTIDTSPIPYCATTSAEWNPRLRKFLVQDLNCCLGTVAETPRNDKVDAEMYTINGENVKELTITVECKNKEKPTGSPDMEKKIKRLPTSGSAPKFNIMLAAELCNTIQVDQTFTTCLDDKKLWLIRLVCVNSTKSELEYSFESWYKPAQVAGIYLLISLETTTCQSPRFYKDICKYFTKSD